VRRATTGGYFDLQVIEEPLQVKTAIPRAGSPLPPISLSIKQLAWPLHVHMLVEIPHISWAGLPAASLAANGIVRISLLDDQGEQVMRQVLRLAALAAAFGIFAHPAVAQEKLKIGLIVTLSGPAAALGQQVRDGFNLAIKDLGGKMGGRDVEVVIADDELKPDGAVTKVKGLLERDKVDFVVGPIFSNILQAIHKPVTDNKTFLISPNAGPSSYAGKNCSPFFYVTSYQNDQVHEVLGKVAQDRGYKRVYVMVPNYQAGKDSAAGFKLDYKGEIVEESYVPLGTLDFQVELSKIASQKPDAVFTFMPGGMGVSLVKQYSQAGLADKIPVLSAFTVDESTLPAQQDAAVGMFGGADWAPDLNNPQSKKFVAGYEAAYNSVPGSYAMQGYDAALLIDSAVKAVKGDLVNKDAVAAALKKADFASLRGNFKFNVNGYPIQDFYLTKVAKRADGKFQTEIVQKVFENYGDRYAKECVPGN
jgi:branched-chain amino acid transport system substrate-binding protein